LSALIPAGRSGDDWRSQRHAGAHDVKDHADRPGHRTRAIAFRAAANAERVSKHVPRDRYHHADREDDPREREEGNGTPGELGRTLTLSHRTDRVAMVEQLDR